MGWINRNVDADHFMGLSRYILRIAQLVLALTVAGLYGIRINAERKAHASISHDWLFAAVVAGLAALTAIVYMVPAVKSFLFFIWDAVLFFLWVTVFGIFGKIYIHRGLTVQDRYQGTDTVRMQRAAWIDLVNVVLWLITTFGGLARFLVYRRQRSLHTGRALLHA